MQASSPPKTWREGRRLRAWELHQNGWKQKSIAEALGVTQGAVSQWLKRAHAQGVHALRARSSPGAPIRLSPDQRALLPSLLSRGAPAFGFRGEIWTRARVAEVIRREFGVSYHRDHIGRVLKSIGWTFQKPIERASQRDDDAIEAWREQTWPQIKKKP